MTKLTDQQKECFQKQNAEFIDYEINHLHVGTINSLPGKTLLDIGCGNGGILSHVDTRWDKYGIDLFENKNADYTHIVMDFENDDLPLEWRRKFDCVNMQAVIEHFLDTDKVLNKANAVLKDGGYLILSTPNLSSLTRTVSYLLRGEQPKFISYHMYDTIQHIRYYTYGALKSQLEEHGFKILKRHGGLAAVKLTRLAPLSVRLKFFEIFPSLGGELVVVCKKV